MKKEEKIIEIWTHNEVVIIDKLFWPTIFANLKIVPDVNKWWIVYREWIKTWKRIEWCTIPAQIEEEFNED